jgi:hypothetical protein
MPLGALHLIVWILGGGLIVSAVWQWMIRRIERVERQRAIRRAHKRAERFKNL